nr:ribonuclease H-like domain-containing protein [Tanacetum cinerariifolium]
MSVYNSVHNTPHNSVHNTPHNSDDEADPNQAVTLISKLDLSHPLHQHPNDSTTLTIVSIKLKGTENYNVWSCAMLLAFEDRNKIGFIDNTCRRDHRSHAFTIAVVTFTVFTPSSSPSLSRSLSPIGRYGVSVPALTKDHEGNKINKPYPVKTNTPYWKYNFLKDSENEILAIVYNDAQTSKSDLLTESILSPQHIDEFDLKDETSLFEYDEEEQNILNFNELFPFDVIYPNDSKSGKGNDDDKFDIEHSSRDLSVKPLPDVINTDVGAYAHGSNKLLETSHDTSNKFFKTETFVKELK